MKNHDDALKIPPHSEETEQAVLSAMIGDYPTAKERLYTELEENDFYSPQHQYIFRAIKILSESGKPVDLLTLTEALSVSGKLEIIGSEVYLTELLMVAVSSANIENWAQILREKRTARELLQLSADVEKAVFDNVPTDEIREQTEREISKLASGDIHIARLSDALVKKQKQPPLITGIHDLDGIFDGGLRGGELHILAARPSIGKTALATSIAENVVQRESAVLFFSLEMTKYELGERLIAAHGSINHRRLRRDELHRQEQEAYHNTVKELRTMPLYIQDSGYLDLQQLRTVSRKMYRQQGISLIVIDYLQLMEMPNGNTTNDQVKAISRAMKLLAKELNVPVLCLSQLSRACESRPDKRPQLSDLRDSGAIEQDADCVWLLYRPGFYGLYSGGSEIPKSQTEIIISKNRGGETGSVFTEFELEYCRMGYESQTEAPF